MVAAGGPPVHYVGSTMHPRHADLARRVILGSAPFDTLRPRKRPARMLKVQETLAESASAPQVHHTTINVVLRPVAPCLSPGRQADWGRWGAKDPIRFSGLCMSQALTPCHCAEVSPPTNQAAFRDGRDGVVHRQGLAHGLLWGLRVEMPQAASRGLNQPVQVVHLDSVMGEAHPWCLESMDPSHLRPGPGGLALGHAVGVVP